MKLKTMKDGNTEMVASFCTLIIWTEALVEAKQQHYGPNDEQFKDLEGPQLCPGPDILAHDGLNQAYLPMLFLRNP